jgi:adenylate kinase
VVELKVDPDILIRRIESRIDQMKRRGEALRADDNPAVLKQRLEAYRGQTAPLVDYYGGKGALRVVDGMAPIDDVAAAIGRALADAAFRPVLASKKAAGGPGKASAARKSAAGKVKAAGGASKARRKPAKVASLREASDRKKAKKAKRIQRLTK